MRLKYIYFFIQNEYLFHLFHVPVAGSEEHKKIPTMVEVDALVFETLASTIMASLAITVSITTKERRFRACFGTTAHICSQLWSLCSHLLIAEGAMPVHLLWALLFLKQYNTEEVNASMAGCDEKTFRHWCWLVIGILANMELVMCIVL